jgi:hypothetical protein
MACLQVFSFWLAEEHALDKDACLDFYEFLKKLNQLPLTTSTEFLSPAMEALSQFVDIE